MFLLIINKYLLNYGGCLFMNVGMRNLLVQKQNVGQKLGFSGQKMSDLYPSKIVRNVTNAALNATHKTLLSIDDAIGAQVDQAHVIAGDTVDSGLRTVARSLDPLNCALEKGGTGAADALGCATDAYGRVITTGVNITANTFDAYNNACDAGIKGTLKVVDLANSGLSAGGTGAADSLGYATEAYGRAINTGINEAGGLLDSCNRGLENVASRILYGKNKRY